jgi:hypothetical protein
MTTTPTAPTAPESGAISNARAHLETITGAHKACQWLLSNRRNGNDLNDDARQILRDHNWCSPDAASSEDTAEAVETQMREMPLSLEVRSGWADPGETLELAEFRLLLSTGGPALQLVGSLTESYEACDCELQHQDWFTPWQTLPTTREEDAALEWFAELFTLSLPY